MQPLKITTLSPNLIITPLVVMLFLTVLSGANALYLTNIWEDATQTVSRQMTETVILNNLHWQLSQIKIKAEAKKDAPDLESNWLAAKEQLETLAHIPHTSMDETHSQQLHSLQLLYSNLFKNNTIDREHLNQALLDRVLQQDFFNRQLQKTQGNMERLKLQTQRMIMLISGTLVFLGIILMSITARDLTRMFRELKKSRDMSIQLQEDERRRIAQDLHDSVVQEMVDLKRHYSAEKVDQVIDNLRHVCHNLKPQILDDLGIADAISFLTDDLRHSGIPSVQLNIDENNLAQLPKAYELPIFRILQELCANIKHHAHASNVQITVVYDPDESHWLSVYIKDNGNGFDQKAPFTDGKQHMGLSGVQERVIQLNGAIAIYSTPRTEQTEQRAGTLIQFRIPIQDNQKRQRQFLWPFKKAVLNT